MENSWINKNYDYYHHEEMMKSIKRVWDKVQFELTHKEILHKYPIRSN